MKRESNHHIFLSLVVFGKAAECSPVVVAVGKPEELPWRKHVQEIDKLVAFRWFVERVIVDRRNPDGPGMPPRRSGQPLL